MLDIPAGTAIQLGLAVATFNVGLVLLFVCTRWLISHMDDLVGYRSPTLTMIEVWIPRVSLLLAIALLFTWLHRTSSWSKRFLIVGAVVALLTVIAGECARRFWFQYTASGHWYRTTRTRWPVYTKYATTLLIYTALYLSVIVPLTLVPIIPVAYYGAWRYYKQRTEERGSARFAEAVGAKLTNLLADRNMCIQVLEAVKEESGHIRLRIDLPNLEAMARLEHWLVDEVRTELDAARLEFVPVFDHSHLDDSAQHIIVDCHVFHVANDRV